MDNDDLDNVEVNQNYCKFDENDPYANQHLYQLRESLF